MDAFSGQAQEIIFGQVRLAFPSPATTAVFGDTGPGPGPGMTTSSFEIMAGTALVLYQACLEIFHVDVPFDVSLKPEVANPDHGHNQQQQAEEKGDHRVSLHCVWTRSVAV